MGQGSRPGLVARVRHFKYSYTSPLQPTPTTPSSPPVAPTPETPQTPHSPIVGEEEHSPVRHVALAILGHLALILSEHLLELMHWQSPPTWRFLGERVYKSTLIQLLVDQKQARLDNLVDLVNIVQIPPSSEHLTFSLL
jgi:hypothetical protein